MIFSFINNKKFILDEPLYEITLINDTDVPIYINGNSPATTDSIKLIKNVSKTLGFSGITELYFLSGIDTRIKIEATSMIFFKTVSKGTVGLDEKVIKFGSAASKILVKNLSIGNLYMCPNATINLDNETSYRLSPGEYTEIEQNIEELHIVSDSSCNYEIYATKKE